MLVEPIRVDVWSDVACPWCWVGKRHLQAAIGRFSHPVELRWRAFELDREFQLAFDRSDLPEQPDFQTVDQFLIEARKSVVET